VVEQLTKQGTDATGDGVGWQVVVGAVLAAVLAVGAVIAVVKRRRRPS
jgi:LPXTG-motif cell wall-anchored protein